MALSIIFAYRQTEHFRGIFLGELDTLLVYLLQERVRDNHGDAEIPVAASGKQTGLNREGQMILHWRVQVQVERAKRSWNVTRQKENQHGSETFANCRRV